MADDVHAKGYLDAVTARAWILWLFWVVSGWAHVPAESSLAEASPYRFSSQEVHAGSGLYWDCSDLMVTRKADRQTEAFRALCGYLLGNREGTGA